MTHKWHIFIKLLISLAKRIGKESNYVSIPVLNLNLNNGQKKFELKISLNIAVKMNDILANDPQKILPIFQLWKFFRSEETKLLKKIYLIIFFAKNTIKNVFEVKKSVSNIKIIKIVSIFLWNSITIRENLKYQMQ